MIKELMEHNEGLTLKVEHFDLQQTFECGQCFRWDLVDENHYMGVVDKKVMEIKQVGNTIHIGNINKEELNNIWIDYFDLKRDYQKVIGQVSNDKVMKEAIKYGEGIRILNQDEWETLISFIISANNNIPRIKKILQSFCHIFGEKILYKGQQYHTFPKPKDLVGIDIKDLCDIKCGYRAGYIVDAVEKINNREVDLYGLKRLPTEDARKELLKIKGVGPKVADCILLFSMGKYDCYPMDVWIKKITEAYYFQREATAKEIQEFARELWGKNAGFAQQYLFYYARNHLNNE